MSVTREGETQSSGWVLKGPLEMSDLQFRQWSTLLEERTGMSLQPDRKSFLQAGVAVRMRELAFTDYQSYFNLISDAQRGALEWITLVDRLTIHETRFFRNPDAYRLVREYLASRQDQISQRDPCDVWSIGCSSGEEAYSLAMVMHEVLGRARADATFSITGTDISLPVLYRARAGSYPQARLQPLPEHYRERYFRKSADAADTFEVVAELKRRVCFSQSNLLDLEQNPIRDLQIIFCLNLLIYFRRTLRERLLGQLLQRLKPGGLLVIGAGDAPNWKPDGCELLPDRSVQAYVKQTGPLQEAARETH